MDGFQTNVFRDGGWVTTTVSTQEALEATARMDAAKALDFQSNPPTCGIMTRTVAPSPIAHWILPVRIRSKSFIDVAFIGSNSVHISELRRDGQLVNVIRKDDFGSRIRNAVVMGDTPDPSKDVAEDDYSSVRLEDAVDSTKGSSSFPGTDTRRRRLPPQFLVLFLESGHLIFLYLIPGAVDPWEFDWKHYRTPGAIKNLGFRMAIDPTSRYLTAASSQKAFMIWELEARAQLEKTYEVSGTFEPLKKGETGGIARSFQGTLFHLDFLFPRPGDFHHIILTMVIARRDRYDGPVASRVLTFDWIRGEDVNSTLKGDSNGIRLPEHYNMPILIIPLRFKTSLCVVAEHHIGVIKNVISGSMVCEDLMTERPPRTSLHHGLAEPLWTAWARPIRGDWYYKNTDIIMLAREDGYLVHVEVEADHVVPSVTSAGCLDSTISTAFAMPYIEDADAVIVCGDSSPGGTWKLSPRSDPIRTSTLRNWSPVVDITTAPLAAPPKFSRRSDHRVSARTDGDLLITASGRGAKGCLATLRWGQQARIGCDIDTETTVGQIGAYMATHDGLRLLHVALSMPEGTMVLQFSSDLLEVRALEAGETALDQASRTLRLYSTTEQIVQISENCITVVKGSQSYQQLLLYHGIDRAEHASCTTVDIVLSSQTAKGSALHTYRIHHEGITPTSNWQVDGEVTCLTITTSSPSLGSNVVAGTMVEGYPMVSVFDLNGLLIAKAAIALEEAPTTQHAEAQDHTLYESLTSLRVVNVGQNSLDILAGTVWGRVITLAVSLDNGKIETVHTRRFGKSAARLYALVEDDSTQDVVVICDDNLALLADYDPVGQKHMRDAVVIPTSDADPASHVPPVQWVTAVPSELRLGSDLTPLLLLAGTRVLIAELSPTPQLIPKGLPTGGTPTKVIYSDVWKCYIVAVIQDGAPTIAFVDPATGHIISQPTTNDRRPTTFASGLGSLGDRIMCMEEWSYIKDGRVFPYILVGMQGGLLLTMSAKSVEVDAETGTTRRIEYWMRHKRKGNSEEPVYAVLGVEDGMVHCSGDVVYYEVLEAQHKRMREVTSFHLDSPAVQLRVRNDKLFVLTSRHSLMIFDHHSTGIGTASKQMKLLHVDTAARGTIHMIPMQVPSAGATEAEITMLSDASSNVIGVWTVLGKPEQALETVFKASLPVPIRRFVQGRCRAPWHGSRTPRKFGTWLAANDGSDTFGVALDGGLYHFTVLQPELFELLRFIQSRAERTTGLVTFTRDQDPMEEEADEARKHINGDLMSRCLKSRALERIMAPGEFGVTLCKLLDRIEGGTLTEAYRDDEKPENRYFELAYQILEYLDVPVLC